VNRNPTSIKTDKEVLRQIKPSVESIQIPDSEGGLDLGQAWSVIRRKIFLIIAITASVTALSAVKAIKEKPIYSSKFEILTKAVTAENEVVSSVPQTLGNQQQDDKNTTLTSDKTKIKVLLSPAILFPVVKRLQSKHPELSYYTLSKNLVVESKEPNVITASYQEINSALVKDVMNGISQAYLKYSLEDRQKDFRQGIIFVNQQIPRLESQVYKQQAKLQKLRIAYNFIEPEAQAEQYASQASSISQSMSEVRIKLDETRLLHKGLKDELARQPVESASSSALDGNQRYQKLLAQVSDIDTKLTQDLEVFEEDNPRIKALRGQRQKLVLLLQREANQVEYGVSSQIRELDNRKQALAQSSELLNQKIRQLSIVTGQYADIQRELKIAIDNLNQFLAKREGLRIESAQQQVPWQLLTPPGEPEAAINGLKRTLALGMILGILLGIGTALVVDKLSDVIHSSKEIKDLTKLPILGIIPFNPYLEKFTSLKELNLRLPFAFSGFELNDEHTHTSERELNLIFLEAFRSAYVNIRLISPDKPVRSIVVSSPASGHGKTTTAINLAIVAAAMGQRVLLIDADLRRPMLHQRMSLTSMIGLTDLISENLDLPSVVEQTSWEKNLFVLPAGTVPPDPTRILSSQAMQKLVTQSREHFDLVIFDTSPLLGLADPYLLSSLADGILMVVPLGQLKRSIFLQTLEALDVSGTPVLGIIANSSKERPVNHYSTYRS
jgi:polysaccharide biosynthesis transport protein